MEEIFQHSAGVECGMKKRMLAGFLCLIFSMLIKDSISTSASNGYSAALKNISNNSSGEIASNASRTEKLPEESLSHSLSSRTERSLSREKNPTDFLLETILENEKNSEFVQKEPTKSKAVFIIPYLRPGRSVKEERLFLETNEKKNTVIPMPRFGRSDKSHLVSSLDNKIADDISKKRDTLIPVIRFGRSDSKYYGISLNSIIPYPRFGRFSTSEDYSFDDREDEEYMKKGIRDESSDLDYEEYINQETLSQWEKEGQSDGIEDEGIASYPWPGYSNLKNTQKINTPELNYRRSDNEYVLPQIRYGRSMILFKNPKGTETNKQNTETFVLPYPRPGRSNGHLEKEDNNNALSMLIPYDTFQNSGDKYTPNDYKKRQGYMVPNARFGRSNMNSQFEIEGDTLNSERFLGLKINPLLLNSDRKDVPVKPKDLIDNSSEFVIPYPRPGKKSILEIPNENNKYLTNFVHYLLPYTSLDKKSTKESQLKQFKNLAYENNDNNVPHKTFVVPYPRPGRSENVWLENENSGDQQDNMNNKDNFRGVETNLAVESVTETDSSKGVVGSTNSGLNPSEKSVILFPYARLGKEPESTKVFNNNLSLQRLKRSSSVLPYPRLGRAESVVPYPRSGRSESVVPYPRPGRSESVVPYPRPGRSESVVPYPRPGRSESVVPYPRPGRSESVVPYPRPGRSESVVPYPRPGRSESVVPYPRPGRSDSVVPYPRPGRSDSVVPYPRLGRSDTVLPYQRMDRSDSVIPNPRMGRSLSVIPYPRMGRSNSVVPYPRMGRLDSVIPYPRMGRSNSVVPYPRMGRSYSVVPYSRLERSDTKHTTFPKNVKGELLLPNIRPGRSKLGKDEYLLPYPRPGRSDESMVIPYPRPGPSTKSGKRYVLPNPRIVKLNENDESNSDTVIPYPRLGRSQKTDNQPVIIPNSAHKLNKHMLSKGDESIYLLPYPRPGRFLEDS